MMPNKLTIKNEQIATYLNTDNAVEGFAKAVNNGQTRLALQVLVEIIEELTEYIQDVDDIDEEENVEVAIIQEVQIENEQPKTVQKVKEVTPSAIAEEIKK